MVIQKIEDKSWLYTSEAYEICRYSMYKPDDEKYRKMAKGLEADPNIHVFACFDSNKPIGLITLKKDEQTAKIVTISVSPDYRLRGIGRMLIEYALAQMKMSVLETETDDEAVGFYKHVGFSAKPLLKHFPDGDVTRYVCKMIK